VRWLITGSGGRLGTALVARLTADDPGLIGAEDDVILPLDRISLDVTDTAAVREAVSDFRADVVVNTAAYCAGEPGAALTAEDTAFDGDAAGDEQRAYSVNAVGPAVLALAVAATGGRRVMPRCPATNGARPACRHCRTGATPCTERSYWTGKA
jgi:dTDP-4-dehydrorhamnose reductase